MFLRDSISIFSLRIHSELSVGLFELTTESSAYFSSLRSRIIWEGSSYLGSSYSLNLHPPLKGNVCSLKLTSKLQLVANLHRAMILSCFFVNHPITMSIWCLAIINKMVFFVGKRDWMGMQCRLIWVEEGLRWEPVNSLVMKSNSFEELETDVDFVKAFYLH